MCSLGEVTTILGSMYAGKSTFLMRYLNRASIAKKNVILYKPRIDNRYSVDSVVSHDGHSFPATVIDSYKELYDCPDVDVVGIDEVQFFDVDIWQAINELAKRGTDIVVAGLSTDFMGQVFETSATVAMMSNTVELLTAICVKCGEDAVWTQMVSNGAEVTDGERVQVGGIELYEPRCRRCFVR